MSLRAYSRASITDRMFNRPLAITRQKADIVLGVIGPRLNVSQLVVMGEAVERIPIAKLADSASISAANIGSDTLLMPGDAEMQRRDWNTGALLDPYETFQGVAILPVRGTLMAENGLDPVSGATGYDGLSFKYRHAQGNPAVKGLLWDIDSPGGEVTDLHELCDMIASGGNQKPMRAMVRGQCASAAYEMLAAVCGAGGDSTIPETGFAGSIGVITMHADFSKQLEQEGVTVTLLYEGPHKADGNPFEPLPADVETEIRADLSRFYGMFVDRVAAWRGLDADAVRATQSRLFNAEQAVQLGLVDKIMSWTDSLAEFVAQVNGRQPANSQRAAIPAPRTSQENASVTTITSGAPAAEHQPENTVIETILATQAKADVEAAAAGERARVLALIDLCPESTISASLQTAIQGGIDAGAYAIELTQAAKARGASVTDLKAGAVQEEQLPVGTNKAAISGSAADKKPGLLQRVAAMGHRGLAHLNTGA